MKKNIDYDALEISKVIDIQHVMYDIITLHAYSQMMFRDMTMKWFTTIALAAAVFFSTDFFLWDVNPRIVVLLISWGGFLGLLSACMSDIFHFQVMRRAAQSEVWILESRYDIPKIQQHLLSGDSSDYDPPPAFQFYLFCLGTILLLSMACSTDLIYEYFSYSWAVFNVVIHIVFMLYLWIKARSKIQLNYCIGESLPKSAFDFTSDIDDSSWKSLLASFKVSAIHFSNSLQGSLRLRKLAAAITVTALSSMGIIFSGPEDLLGIGRLCLFAMIGLAGLLMVILIWMLDAQGPQSYIKAVIQEGIKRENQYDWVPRVYSSMIRVIQDPGASPAIVEYFSCIQVLMSLSFFALGVSFLDNYGLIQYSPFILSILLSPFVYVFLSRITTSATVLSIDLGDDKK